MEILSRELRNVSFYINNNIVNMAILFTCRYKSLKDLKDEIYDRHANLQDLSSGLVEFFVFIFIIFYYFLLISLILCLELKACSWFFLLELCLLT